MLRLTLLTACLATPTLAQDLVFFRSPSGNIGCMIATGDWAEARCDLMQLTSPIPPAPADCDLDWGHAFGIGPQDTRGYRICAGDTVMDPSSMVLNYGDHIDLAGFRCTSEKTGMTCTNPAGHGFTIAKASQKLF